MKFTEKIKQKIFYKKKDFITLYPEFRKSKKRVLLSYLTLPINKYDTDSIFRNHSNMWESREIARIFQRQGYVVDIIDFTNHSFIPSCDYDIVFDIDINLQRLMPYLKKECKKILHMTGSYSRFQNYAEMKRVKDFEVRKNVFYSPKRLDSFLELVDRSLTFADKISLIGNDFVLHTFPEKVQNKMVKVPVSASYLTYLKSKKDFVPNSRGFLWFFGGGAVHKGLDRVLEVFLKNQNLKLHIVGNVKGEKDFWQVFEKDLINSSNIFYHGYLSPSSLEFENIVKNAFCFIAPSCSEATSAAVVTCLQIGLYPIISRNTGVDLPEGCGMYLDDCSIIEIEKVIKKIYDMNSSDLESQITLCQKYALKNFSRENFSLEMTKFIQQVIS